MKTKRFLCALLCAGMLFTLMPVTAWGADTTCEYIDENGVEQSTTATIIEGSGPGETLAEGWYIVQDAGVTRSSTVTIDGDVYLILADGASLAVTGGTNDAGIRVTPGNTLTIYGQSLGTGALTANGGDSGAGIGGGQGGNGGTVTINGGTVNALGDLRGAGIGGGNEGDGGTVTINGGTVNAQGNLRSAGIGGGNEGDGGTVTINGGTVNAIGGYSGAGIGGGWSGAGGTVTINGGTVSAQGGESAAGIGGGVGETGASVTINGGTVRAQGGAGAQYIGHGAGGTGGTLKNEGDVDVFLTTITLYGVSTSTQTPANSLNTSADYYGMHDVNTDDSGKLYLYLPQEAVTIGVQTPSTPYAGVATTADSPTAFTFIEQVLTEREIELRTENGQIQWRYTDETEWHDLMALSEITGPQGETGPAGTDGTDGSDGADGTVGANGGNGGREGKDGEDGNGIAGITKTATEGHVDTYTITLTDGTMTSFTVTNGKDGADGKDGTGIEGSAIDENGDVVLTLTDGTQLKIDDDILPAGAAAPPEKSGGNATATISLIIAIIALLSHLGWLIPLLLRKKGV